MMYELFTLIHLAKYVGISESKLLILILLKL